jgi:protein-tyrosine phosphatase
MIDLHNHLIPGVDDGASTLDESRAALRAFASQGIDTIVVTPHFNGSLTLKPTAAEARLAELDAGWAKLSAMAAAEFPNLTLGRGVEMLADTPTPDLSDGRLRLAGSDFALIEFPGMSIPPKSTEFVSRLVAGGWRVVIAHPERYYGMERGIERAGEWRRAGALLQINAGSIVGKYGPAPRIAAFELLARGWADYMGSDYHARGTLHTRAACELLKETNAEEQVVLLTELNPRRLLAGEAPWPVRPVIRKPGFFERIKTAMRPPL